MAFCSILSTVINLACRIGGVLHHIGTWGHSYKYINRMYMYSICTDFMYRLRVQRSCTDFEYRHQAQVQLQYISVFVDVQVMGTLCISCVWVQL